MPTPQSTLSAAATHPARSAHSEHAMCVLLETGALQPHLRDRTLALTSRAIAAAYASRQPEAERWSQVLATNLNVPPADIVARAEALRLTLANKGYGLTHGLELVRAIKHGHTRAHPMALSARRLELLATALLAGKEGVSLAQAQQMIRGREESHGDLRKHQAQKIAWARNCEVAKTLCLPLVLFKIYERCGHARNEAPSARRSNRWASCMTMVAVNLCVLPTMLPLLAMAYVLSQYAIALGLPADQRARLRALQSPAVQMLDRAIGPAARAAGHTKKD